MNQKDAETVGAGQEVDTAHTPPAIKLSPEERVVLLNCRRHSLARGFISGAGVSMAIYWFKMQGRVPAAVNRFPSLVYSLSFFGAFVAGAGSYQKTCLKKIMSLENSVIAEHYRKAVTEIEKNLGKPNTHRSDGIRPLKKPLPYPSSMPKQVPQDSPPAPNVKLEEGPSINATTYHRDRSMLETREEDSGEQPSAFSGESNRAPLPFSDAPEETGSRRGRTFDEIREENRRRHEQQNYPSSSSSPQRGTTSGSDRIKRNKYGDPI